MSDDGADARTDPGAGVAADDGADEPAASTLALLLDDLAGEFPDVARREDPARVAYEVAGRPFATLSGQRAEFRLRPEIAAAAAKTPDARVAPTGPEWVAFAPADVDQHAIDRAQAWFELAHRLATEPGGRSRA